MAAGHLAAQARTAVSRGNPHRHREPHGYAGGAVGRDRRHPNQCQPCGDRPTRCRGSGHRLRSPGGRHGAFGAHHGRRAPYAGCAACGAVDREPWQQPAARAPRRSQRYRTKRVNTTMKRQIIQTEDAPKAIGTYSQAVRAGDTVYVSGQIPLDPASGQIISGDIEAEIRRVFENLKAIAQAAGGSLANVVKLNVFLTDLTHFPKVNEIMAIYFSEPYPARAAVGVAALPRDARVEMECVLSLP